MKTRLCASWQKAMAAGEDILEVAQHLSIKMLDRLEKWKSERFETSETDQSVDETPPSGSTLAS